MQVSKAKEDDIVEVSQRVLYLAQNFERAFPGLENLKKTHFVNITQLLWNHNLYDNEALNGYNSNISYLFFYNLNINI